MSEPRFVSPDLHYADLEAVHPRDILEFAVSTIDRLAVATSFQSSGLVILHLLKDIKPDVPVLFLDTGFHFRETLEFRKQICDMWDLKLVDLHGAHGSAEEQARIYGPALYENDPDRCCHINKVAPLQEALEEFDGWMSGLRRDQSPLRAATPIVEAQLLPSGNEVMKIHPLARWTAEDVANYAQEYNVPTHPLLESGYRSIGCFPCTRAITSDEDERAGRWEGFTKTECGIHSFGRNQNGRQSEAEQ